MKQRTFVNYNGQIKDSEKAVLPIDNRGFRYADGFFETIRMINGRLMFFELHFKRILKAMSLLHLPIPVLFSDDWLKNEILHLFRVNKIMKSGIARIAFTRQSGGRYFPEGEQILNYLIETQSYKPASYSLNEKGLKIGVYEKGAKNIMPLSFCKSIGNAQLSVLASIEAQQKGYDDMLLENINKELIEATSSNVFFIKENVLYTPSVDSGCVQGVMRQIIIDMAQKLNYTIIEGAVVYKNQLPNFDEIFFTNAVAGIRWVLAFEDKRYYNNIAKQLVVKLNEMI